MLPTLFKLGTRRDRDIFDLLLFFFFFTLHADKLNLAFGGFSLRLNNFVTFALVVGLFVRFRIRSFTFNKHLLLGLLAVGVSVGLSLLASPYPKRCLFFFCWYGFTVLCYVVLPYLLVSLFGEKRVLKAYFISFLAVGSYAVFQLALSTVKIQDPFCGQFIIDGWFVRPNGCAYEPSYYALYMTPFVMLVNFHYLANRTAPFFSFAPLQLKHLLFVNFIYVVSTSTSTLFAYLVFFAVVFFLSFNPRFGFLKKAMARFFFGFLGILLACGLCFPFLMKRYFFKFFMKGFTLHGSFLQRWAMIENAWNLFLERPLFGIGLGGIPSYFYDAWIEGSQKYRFVWQGIFLEGSDAGIKQFEPTNVITELLGSLGIVGLLAFAFLIGTLFYYARKSLSRAPISVINLAISVIVMLVVLQFNQSLLRTYIWTHFALCFALIERIGFQTKSLSPASQELEAWA